MSNNENKRKFKSTGLNHAKNFDFRIFSEILLNRIFVTSLAISKYKTKDNNEKFFFKKVKNLNTFSKHDQLLLISWRFFSKLLQSLRSLSNGIHVAERSQTEKDKAFHSDGKTQRNSWKASVSQLARIGWLHKMHLIETRLDIVIDTAVLRSWCGTVQHSTQTKDSTAVQQIGGIILLATARPTSIISSHLLP